ncbi:MAG: ankyrin repeat domain-containing protein [Candidatus Omnitrophica bacterium]|nr:ankyrin repeat domain-containing protein [Candidatus Omnitrophota bacterium]
MTNKSWLWISVLIIIVIGCSPVQTIRHNNEALLQSITNNDIDSIRALISDGADVNVKGTINNRMVTPLVLAAANGYTEIAKFLLDNGADVNARAFSGGSALTLASLQGHNGTVKVLIDKGANVNAKDDNGLTALSEASRNGHSEIVKFLLLSNADVNTKTNEEITALMIAVTNGYTEIVETLLNNGADINANDAKCFTALIFAAGSGQNNMVNLLLDRGVDINAQDVDGVTALMYALRQRHPDTAKILINNGADVNIKNVKGGTGLMVAADEGQLEIVNLLIANGADVNAKTRVGFTALKTATEKGFSEIVNVLKNSGATDLVLRPSESTDISDTDTNPLTIIENIKKNGTGNRFFIKDIPLSSKMMAACFFEGYMNCVSGVNDVNITDNVTLASFKSSQDIIKQGNKLAEDALNKFSDVFAKPIYILYSKTPPKSLADIKAPLGNGSVHEIFDNVKMGQYIFINEGGEFCRLTFGIIEPYGYVYLIGKGKIILPDGTEIKLGYKPRKTDNKSVQ